LLHTLPFSHPPVLLHLAAHPRDPRPFPTRRSSDLSVSKSAATPASFFGVKNSKEKTGSPRSAAKRSMSVILICPDSPRRTPLRRDRKSTRLNSSHGSISYAVFCLKKKNNPRSHRQH